MESLDSLAHRFGTDKRSGHHGYTTHYDRVFGSKREQVRKVVEIGVNYGSSLRMWEQYFPNAQIFGIDNNPGCLQYQSERVKVLIADQSSETDLKKVLEETGQDLDIVVDDGGHFMSQQITSFRFLFPAMRSGGFYVIEDLCTSYWERYGGGPPGFPGTAIAFLKCLIDDVNKNGIEFGDHERALGYAKSQGIELSEYSKSIVSIQFFQSMAFIEKR